MSREPRATTSILQQCERVGFVWRILYATWPPTEINPCASSVKPSPLILTFLRTCVCVCVCVRTCVRWCGSSPHPRSQMKCQGRWQVNQYERKYTYISKFRRHLARRWKILRWKSSLVIDFKRSCDFSSCWRWVNSSFMVYKGNKRLELCTCAFCKSITG